MERKMTNSLHKVILIQHKNCCHHTSAISKQSVQKEEFIVRGLSAGGNTAVVPPRTARRRCWHQGAVGSVLAEPDLWRNLAVEGQDAWTAVRLTLTNLRHIETFVQAELTCTAHGNACTTPDRSPGLSVHEPGLKRG